ncbi:MAG: sugar phosphate nucleotidyltransferase [Candidatus Daviesbacteria bacterium]|nr:sugar phosphate nucleotidyltransferase [Candidatus Daviesbacteria bacterium]
METHTQSLNEDSIPNSNSKQAFEVKVIVMAGGKGRRIESITKGEVPKDFITIDKEQKIRGIDYIRSILRNLELNDVTYSANYYYGMYKEALSDTPYKLHYQQEGDNHGTDLYKIITEQGVNYQYLVLTTDMYFGSSDLQEMINTHKVGTATWATAHFQFPEMEPYRCLVVDDKTNAVLGDPRSLWWQRNGDTNPNLYIEGSIIMTDPELYLQVYRLHTRLYKKLTGLDLYSDVGFLLAEKNRRRVAGGFDSIFNACMFTNPFIDYGNPERLELVRRVFSDSLYDAKS